MPDWKTEGSGALKQAGGNPLRVVVQISGISLSYKIRLFLSSGFRNEGFMISIRRKTDNAFTGLFQNRRAGRELGGILIFALVLYSNTPNYEHDQNMELTTSWHPTSSNYFFLSPFPTWQNKSKVIGDLYLECILLTAL